MFKVTRFGQCVASLVPHLLGVHGFWLDSCEATQPKFEGVDVSFGVTERLEFIPRVSCLANSSWSIRIVSLSLGSQKQKQKNATFDTLNMFIKILFPPRFQLVRQKNASKKIPVGRWFVATVTIGL